MTTWPDFGCGEKLRSALAGRIKPMAICYLALRVSVSLYSLDWPRTYSCLSPECYPKWSPQDLAVVFVWENGHYCWGLSLGPYAGQECTLPPRYTSSQSFTWRTDNLPILSKACCISACPQPQAVPTPPLQNSRAASSGDKWGLACLIWTIVGNMS